MEVFQIKLVSPEGVIFDDSIWQISACNSAGSFAIRAHHADFFTSLNPCILELARIPENRERYRITSGFLEFQCNVCTVICEDIITKVEN